MLALKPIDLKKVSEKNISKQALRLGMIAELDAVNLYEQLAARTGNDRVKKVLLDVAKEEKTHVGEFQALLLRLDPEQKAELEAGKREVGNLGGIMPAAWSRKDERQYEHILRSCRRTDRRRSPKTCKRIAAATVNKQRRAEGRTLSGLGQLDTRVCLQPATLVALVVGVGALTYVLKG
jgi:rubrerythrin